MNLRTRSKSFGGWVEFYEHDSTSTQTKMRFSIYRPPQAEKRKVPVLFWLSGLTCTEENFMQKSGAQKLASEMGLCLVAPDTSPRGAGIPGEGDSYDFGLGAGFYLNATEKPWNKNYRMYDYVVKELRSMVLENFPVRADQVALSGHSMGGHGALVIGLRNPDLFRSVSALAPISAPSECPWGMNAFRRYLGDDKANWLPYDSCYQIKNAKVKRPILVDQGTEDQFLKEHLWPEHLEKAAKESGYPLELRYQAGYDHSYYFVASFLADHLKFHLG